MKLVIYSIEVKATYLKIKIHLLIIISFLLKCRYFNHFVLFFLLNWKFNHGNNDNNNADKDLCSKACIGVCSQLEARER